MRIVRSPGLWLALLLPLLLGACVTGPSYPLLSPIAATGSFGYAEAPLGGDRFSVSYVTPPRLAGSYAGPHEADANAVRTLGYDMAVWRAAQLAEAQGFAGFRVSDRRSDVSVYPDPYSSYYQEPLFWDPYWAHWHRSYYDYGPFPPTPPRTYIQGRVTIDVTLLHEPQPGDYNARDAVEQLRRTYPGAEGVVAPAVS